MVTSNKLPDRKVVKMAEHNNSVVVPQRTLLGEVNEHIMCPLCRGYYIDATTIVECLHSFCRSCIIKHLQVKSYCPVCEMMINSAKPNIKLDKALQDIVYKLVPGLFQKEMERRQQFYSSRPGPAASATPEQRGEDTERVIFSPEDVISFSLEYADATDADSISSKSSDSNELQPVPATTRRFLQCPAVVNISHLKKFLSMKFDIDSTQFAIDILYKRVPLPDYYTLMDIAYIYNWKRNEPMRFFYQIIDYIAIRNRLFDVNRKGSNFRDRKSSPASTEDTNISSPTLHLNDQGSEASSGTDSPMPEESTAKQSHNSNISERSTLKNQDIEDKTCPSPKKLDEDVEKSQFLNSFELTPKSNCVPTKSSPNKISVSEDTISHDATKTSTNSNNEDTKVLDTLKKKYQIQPNTPNKDDGKAVDTLKRKYQIPPNTPEMKKLKIELEKAKIPLTSIKSPGAGLSTQNQDEKFDSLSTETKINEGTSKSIVVEPSQLTNTPPSILPIPAKDNKQQSNPIMQQNPENLGKRTSVCPQNVSSPKRRPNEAVASVLAPPVGPKTISPLKLQMPKLDSQSFPCKPIEPPKPTVKKMPDLKPSTPTSQIPQSKVQPATTIRMDLLANNSDPTIDRSKILSQVKTSLSPQTIGQSSGDPLKSLLFDSCKINIPSSLSITLTDQKLDLRNQSDSNVDPKKGVVNKNLAGASNGSSHKVPSPPVHNYIEILKLPDSDPKKLTKPDPGTGDAKTNPQNKMESPTQSKGNKSSETSSTKGPVPNLKPIADTKLGKQSGNYSSPITFQQTFEQQVQSMQCDKKSKLPKNKAQVPKLMPATSKSFPGKPNGSINKPNTSTILAMENKTAAALDLSTPHSIQNQLGQQQTFDKVFETMQSIANLAKKQSLPTKGLPLSMSQNNVFPSNRPMNTGVSPLRIPSTSNMNQVKIDKAGTSMTQLNNSRQELVNMKTNLIKPSNSASPTIPSASYQIAPHPSPSPTHPSPRSQTRSPSSSPKLVIAEDKQGGNVTSEQSLNQSNQITSTQLPHLAPKSVSPKAIPGPSRPGLKPAKTLPPVSKITGIRQPITPTLKPGPQLANPSDYLTRPQLMAHQHHALLRHQIEMNAWIKAQRQDILKNMSSMAHQTQNDFNNKDKQ